MRESSASVPSAPARLLGTLGLAMLLCGCLGARPPVPLGAEISLPALWRSKPAPSAPATPSWWRAFGDPALDRLIGAALARNADIGLAQAHVREARALFRFAHAQQEPIAAFSGSAAQSRVLVLAEGADGFGASPTAALSDDFDIFGKLASATGAARATLLASVDTRDAVALAVAGGVASGYINLLGLDARLETTRATLKARAEALRVARRRANAGYTSNLELRQAEAEYEATEQLIPAAALAVTRQENGLSILVGVAPGAIERGKPLAGLAMPAIPVGLPSSLLRRRPDLAAARASLEAGERSLDAARAAELPDFALTGDAGVAMSTALPNMIGLYTIGASVTSPLFDAGRLRARAGASAAQRDQAAFTYRRAVLTALEDVENDLASVQRLAEQQTDIDLQVATLTETLRLATNRYRDGYASYLDQIDAERSLLAAQLVAIQLQADRYTALVSLCQAMGGGWSERETPSSTPLTPRRLQ